MIDDPKELIAKAVRYLQLCGERRLEEASELLGPYAKLTFPGAATFTNLQDMVADASQRYREVRKADSAYFIGRRVADNCEMVISTGVLNGTTLDGLDFHGVRYLDMLIFRDGLIVEQRVFNDLAEHGVSTGLGKQNSDGDLPKGTRLR